MRRLCARCHALYTGVGHADVPEHAALLLRDLRRLALTRVIVREAVAARRAHGDDVDRAQRRLGAVDRAVGDPALEWHRFDLERVERVTLRAIRELEGVYDDLR